MFRCFYDDEEDEVRVRASRKPNFTITNENDVHKTMRNKPESTELNEMATWRTHKKFVKYNYCEIESFERKGKTEKPKIQIHIKLFSIKFSI